MSTLEDWVELCYNLAAQPKDLTAGTRKIIRRVEWNIDMLDESINLTHSGYNEEKGIKLKQLSHHYLNKESLNRAVSDWGERLSTKRYGSVGVTTHGNHKERYTKQGFCIQCFTLTLIQARRDKPMHTSVDVFYRTTEVMKKFGADLVFLRDYLLKPFDFSIAPVEDVNFYFANVSAHPMFYPLLAIVDDDWIDKIKRIERQDSSFYRSIVRWSNRCLLGTDREKFMQAMRVTRALEEQLSPRRLRKLTRFTEREMEKWN